MICKIWCEECYGTGQLGRAKNGKIIACETCGGHEDALGAGFVEIDCPAPENVNKLRAEVSKLRSRLGAVEK